MVMIGTPKKKMFSQMVQLMAQMVFPFNTLWNVCVRVCVCVFVSVLTHMCTWMSAHTNTHTCECVCTVCVCVPLNKHSPTLMAEFICASVFLATFLYPLPPTPLLLSSLLSLS